MNKMSELCKLVVKIEKFNFKLYSSNVIVIFRYYHKYNSTINVVNHVTIRFVTIGLL